MAGIDWFRWHHGTVTDQKFPLIAHKAGSKVSEVIAVWACLLEAASMADPRGNPGTIDFEALDFSLGMSGGQAQAIHKAMQDRGLLGEDGSISSWDKRQPKKEDDSANERKRRQREREHELAMARVTTGESRDVTLSHADVTRCHARVEESREERREEEKSPAGDSAKVSDLCPHSAIVELYHTTLPTARRIRDWTPARQQALRSRWREKTERQTLDWWQEFFAYVAKSDFLCGRSPAPSGRKPFELSLDWLCKSENFVKVLEGAYES